MIARVLGRVFVRVVLIVKTFAQFSCCVAAAAVMLDTVAMLLVMMMMMMMMMVNDITTCIILKTNQNVVEETVNYINYRSQI